MQKVHTSYHMRRRLMTTFVMRLHRCLFQDSFMSQLELRQVARYRKRSFPALEDFHFRSSLSLSCFASMASLKSHLALPLPPDL